MKVKLHLIPSGDVAKNYHTEQGYLAIDINEIAVWELSSTGALELWFKGISESVSLSSRQISSHQIKRFLVLLEAQFPDVEKLLPSKDPIFDQ